MVPVRHEAHVFRASRRLARHAPFTGAEGGLAPSGASERATGTALGSSGPLPTDPLQGGGQAQSSVGQ